MVAVAAVVVAVVVAAVVVGIGLAVTLSGLTMCEFEEVRETDATAITMSRATTTDTAAIQIFLP